MTAPPPDSTPTVGELLRRLQDNTAYLDRIAAQLATDRDRADLRFVPRGEWVEGRRADRGEVKDISKDIADLQADRRTDAGFRRQVLLAFVVAAFSAIVSVALFIATFLIGR